ncbi:FAD/NAD(P)-binding protein [Desulforudis sp. 1088]|uniref:FAD/NAD(P)-binding protein n=1 Tax=unclassified Candidatus Desulforudis TaxID=2635950 RepID=UPI00349229C0
MGECGCRDNPLLPQLATIREIIRETGDVNTFRITLNDREAMAGWKHEPGQLAMLSVFGVGEAMFSISSAPTKQGFLEFSIKRMGKVTSALHELSPGAVIGIRGPYGNHFPYELAKGKDLLVVGGGFALAPLRSMIDFVLADKNRDDYGRLEIIYGARSYDDLCFKHDLFENWPNQRDTVVYTTIDRAEERWKGHVGFVPAYVEEIAPSAENKIALVCGPPIMIKFVLQALEKLGFRDEQIYSTLELRMKCGVGKCGRCNIGSKFVCLEGPVFSLKDIKELPPEF